MATYRILAELHADNGFLEVEVDGKIDNEVKAVAGKMEFMFESNNEKKVLELAEEIFNDITADDDPWFVTAEVGRTSSGRFESDRTIFHSNEPDNPL